MRQRKLSLVIANAITLILMLFANYGSNVGMFSRQTVADVSHKYDTLFAPAGYAFTIWGLIFLLLIGFVIYQWILLKKGDPKNYIGRTGSWVYLSNIANGLWVYFWTNELLGWSVVIILILLFSLIVLVSRLRLEVDDEPLLTIFFVWWPITFYLGWIMVATIACVSAWLVFTGWSGWHISQIGWAMIMIAAASLLYILLITRRNMREAALVGVWAFIAIAVRQWEMHKNVVYTAFGAAVVLLLTIALHAFQNRKYGIGRKIKRREW